MIHSPALLRYALVTGGLAIVGLTSLNWGCRGSAPRYYVPPAAIVGSAPQLPVAMDAGVIAPPAPEVTGGFDPASVVMVLDDPRLQAARADAAKELYAKAASDIETALVAAPDLQAEERGAWLYEIGRLRALGGDPLGGAKAYGDASAIPGPLADYARFAAASLLEASDKHDEALAFAQAIKETLGVQRELDLVIADALAGKKDLDSAAAIWRSELAKGKPTGWVGVALKFGHALLEHPSVAHAEEAIGVARRVIYEASGGQGVGEAREIESAAMANIPFAQRKSFEEASSDELLARAKSLAGSQQLLEAVKVTSTLVALPKSDRPGELPCEAYMVRGEALSKLKKKLEASDAYGDAIARCLGLPRRAEALFNGGRAAGQAGRWTEALARYADLEKEFPDNRLADDARLRGARAARELGDEARFVTMLQSMPDDYPSGDLVGDGLFELALSRIEKRDWAGAMTPLQQGDKRPRERGYQAAGRFAYFLGRAEIETGSLEQGMQDLGRVVAEYPLSYYMTLAYARLAERDRSMAEKTLRAAIEKEPPGPFVIARSEAFGDPSFVRATWLVRVGEPKLARAELDRLGVSARTAPPEIMWASAFLLSRGGAAKESHGLLRGAQASGSLHSNPGGSGPAATAHELAEWLEHYPAGAWRAPWEVAYPRPFADIVTRETKRAEIPEALAFAIMREESAFEPRVVSPANAVGLMQLIVKTATTMGKALGLPGDAESLKRPDINIALGCHYLGVLRHQFPDDPLLAIPGYNAGGGAPRRWLSERPAEDFDVWVERIPYEETRSYTKRVLTSMAAYEVLYAPDQPSEARSTPLAASPAAKAGATLAAAAP